METPFQIISRETIMPSSPTPDHLRTYNLSYFDQRSPPNIYSSIVIFYLPKESPNPNHPSHDQLKASLSKALTQFYPLAGQFKNDFSVDCNDHGVSYVKVNVARDLSGFLSHHLQPDQVMQLLPFRPLGKSVDPIDQLILGVQVNRFSCGGLAIGVCISHMIADGTALSSFLSAWAAISRDDHHDGVRLDGIVTDVYSLYPAKESLGSSPDHGKALRDNVFTNKFSFHGSTIELLRQKFGNASYRPTRFEALVALIWGAMISIDEDKYSSTPTDSHAAICIVDFRKRMEPPLPQRCIGNNILPVWVHWPSGLDHGLATRKIHEMIRSVDNDYIGKQYPDDDLLKKKRMEEENRSEDPRISLPHAFSSLCGFPYNEVDFGFGKPDMIAPVIKLRNYTALVDAQDGAGGIEAWVGLTKEEMALFEKDPAILEYAKFNPTN